jgi:hypothetical protein
MALLHSISALLGFLQLIIITAAFSPTNFSSISFKEYGDVHVVKQYVHLANNIEIAEFVMINDNIASYIARAETTISGLYPNIRNMPDPWATLVSRKLDSLHFANNETSNILYDIPGPWSRSNQGRDRRQLIVGALALGTVFGFFTQNARITDLEREQEEILHVLQQQDNRVTELLQQRNELQMSVNQLEYRMKLEDQQHAVLNHLDYITSCQEDLRTHIRAVENGLFELYHHRLSPNLIRPHQLRASLTTLKSYARSIQATLPSNSVELLYQLPCSFAYTDTGVKIFVHVPLTMFVAKLLRLDTAILVDHSTAGPVMIAIHPVKDLLLYSPELSLHREMSPSDLSDCLNLGSSHFCQLSTMKRQLMDSCLGSLYLGHAAGTKKHCEVFHWANSWFLIRETKNSVLMFSTEVLPYTIRCANDTSFERVLHGLQRQALDVHCLIQSAVFRYEEPLLPLDADMIQATKAWDIQFFLHPLELHDIAEARVALQAPSDQAVNIKALLDHHRYESTRRVQSWWTMGTTGIAVTLTCVAGAILVCLYIRFKASPTPTPAQ